MSALRACAAGAVAALLGVIAPAAAAQQPQDGGPAGQGGIVTGELAPLTPEGVVPRDDRFKPAPFKTHEIPMVPERIEPVATVPKPGARLRQLDKMTGRTETVEIAAGEEVTTGRLRVRLEACLAPEDNAEHGTMAFVQVWDGKEPGTPPVFSGWMFAESPALSAMDHPRYDLWVMSCTTSPGEASSASR